MQEALRRNEIWNLNGQLLQDFAHKLADSLEEKMPLEAVKLSAKRAIVEVASDEIGLDLTELFYHQVMEFLEQEVHRTYGEEVTASFADAS